MYISDDRSIIQLDGLLMVNRKEEQQWNINKPHGFWLYYIDINYIDKNSMSITYYGRTERDVMFIKLRNSLQAKDNVDGNLNSYNNVLKKQMLFEELRENELKR